MKDNRDPKEVGEFLLGVRHQPNYAHLGLADVVRTAFDGIAIRDYGETDEAFKERLAGYSRPPLSTATVQNGRVDR